MIYDLDGYQKATRATWQGENRFERGVLGLCGEAGEVAEKYKKYYRGDFDREELKAKVFDELGDVMYYMAVIADELGLSLEGIADGNIEKLKSRKQREKIKGGGDNR